MLRITTTWYAVCNLPDGVCRLGTTVADEPFSLERWIQLLIDWIVVDDQASSFHRPDDMPS
jgi:hypothetical protein